MAAIKKPEGTKQTAIIPLRVTESFKADLNEMAQATGVSTSERARGALEEIVKKWKKSTSTHE